MRRAAAYVAGVILLLLAGPGTSQPQALPPPADTAVAPLSCLEPDEPKLERVTRAMRHLLRTAKGRAQRIAASGGPR